MAPFRLRFRTRNWRTKMAQIFLDLKFQAPIISPLSYPVPADTLLLPTNLDDIYIQPFPPATRPEDTRPCPAVALLLMLIGLSVASTLPQLSGRDPPKLNSYRLQIVQVPYTHL